MKQLLTKGAVLAAMMSVLLTGCGSDSAGPEEPSAFSETAADYFRKGLELGALDAVSGMTSDYRRHVENYDSPFLVQYESGYRQGYARNQR